MRLDGQQNCQTKNAATAAPAAGRGKCHAAAYGASSVRCSCRHTTQTHRAVHVRTCAAEQLSREAGALDGRQHGIKGGMPRVQQNISLLSQQEHARPAHAVHPPAWHAGGPALLLGTAAWAAAACLAFSE